MHLSSLFCIPFFAFSLLLHPLIANAAPQETTTYPRNPHVDPGIWNHLIPYFLPYDHPLRPKLDALFSKKRVTLSSATLSDAGFIDTTPGKYTGVVVTRHKRLSGYRLKLLTDDNPQEEWHMWQSRMDGARVIRQVIEKFGYQKIFTVPKKWIYPLPVDPSPPAGSHRKNFILVVENMKVIGHDENIRLWKKEMTPALLKALYTVILYAGLDDSLFPWNVPFLKTGGMAFIDTERFYRWPIPMNRIHPHITRRMGEYWNTLVREKGNSKPQ